MVYEVFSALDMLVLERKQSGSFEPIGLPPPAFVLRGMSARRDPVEVFPYLADFLPEASAIWTSGGRLDSGVWVQQDCTGAERAMEASAVGAGDRNYLVLRVLGSEYEERKSAVQKARETSLLYASLRELARDLANARDELAERNREVERLDRLKSELLANMSHELRTPLNAIIGFSSLLGEERPGTLDADQKEFVAHVQRAARHLMSLISDILDLSKIEAGCLTLERETFALAAAVTDALSTQRAQIESKGLHLQVEADMTFRVYADRVRFTQILLNLLSNAVKFTPPGGTITIRSQHMEGGDLAISVCDTGIGIPAEEHSAIFDKFHQVGSGTRGTREGTGLGLAITKALVEAHGGSIRVESAPGAGSRFTFCLPSTAAGAAMTSERFEFAGEQGHGSPPAASPRRGVIVVDDDLASAALVRAMLHPSFRVRAFEEGAEALTAMTQERPDLVLLDISLPGMNGMEVLRRIRSEARLRNVPVVAVPRTRWRAIGSGFCRPDSTRTCPSPSPAGRVSWP